MVSKFAVGSHAYFIESNRVVREVAIVSRRGDFYIVKFVGNVGSGGMQIRSSKLFDSQEEAELQLPDRFKPSLKKKIGFRLLYDYCL